VAGEEHHAERDEPTRGGEVRRETERDEAERDARERREEAAARRPADPPATNEPPPSMTADPTVARSPPATPPSRVRWPASCGDPRRSIRGTPGEERDGVDAVRQRADVVPPGAAGERLRLPRVEDVPEQHRDGGAGEDPAVDERGGEAEHAAAERVHEQELHEVVEREAEEAVEVAAHEPRHRACGGHWGVHGPGILAVPAENEQQISPGGTECRVARRAGNG
jgi:hypothetical protein